ncbi:hypothetical protein HKCCSP123_19405, partial [Rhodobacterales bacterium HKCCSP123]|nr:hypothetical protein [Rhodobacterales bacterium HKCCSP123]
MIRLDQAPVQFRFALLSATLVLTPLTVLSGPVAAQTDTALPEAETDAAAEAAAAEAAA